MFEGSTLGRYKFYCDGFTKHFDKADDLQAYVDGLKAKYALKSKEYALWDKRTGKSGPAMVGTIS